MYVGALRAQKRLLEPLELELQTCDPFDVGHVELRSSARAIVLVFSEPRLQNQLSVLTRDARLPGTLYLTHSTVDECLSGYEFGDFMSKTVMIHICKSLMSKTAMTHVCKSCNLVLSFSLRGCFGDKFWVLYLGCIQCLRKLSCWFENSL